MAESSFVRVINRIRWGERGGILTISTDIRSVLRRQIKNCDVEMQEQIQRITLHHDILVEMGKSGQPASEATESPGGNHLRMIFFEQLGAFCITMNNRLPWSYTTNVTVIPEGKTLSQIQTWCVSSKKSFWKYSRIKSFEIGFRVELTTVLENSEKVFWYKKCQMNKSRVIVR